MVEPVEKTKLRRGISAAVLLREVMIPKSFLSDPVAVARLQRRHVDLVPGLPGGAGPRQAVRHEVFGMPFDDEHPRRVLPS